MTIERSDSKSGGWLDHGRYLDEVHEAVVPYGAYVTTDRRSLSAPTPGLVELLAWNVAVAFLVNLLAALGYDWVKTLIRKKRRGLMNTDEVLTILERVSTTEIRRLDEAEVAAQCEEARRDAADLLEAHGIPEAKARLCVREIEVVTIRVLQSSRKESRK